MGHHRSSITSTDVPPPNVGTHGQLAPKLRCQHRERFIARAEQTQTGTKGVPSRGRAERDRGSGKGERAGGEPAEVLVEDKNTKEPREERREKKRKKENAARAELFAVEAWRRHAARVELSPLRL